METDSIAAFNCQELRNKDKVNDVINYLNNMGTKILCFQDTQLTDSDSHWL